jgi:agmatinase
MHIGIRGPLYSKQDLADDRSLGFEIFSSVEFEDIGANGAIEKLRQRVGNRPMYISIDIDVLDPSHAPGTGTPEAGGLTSRELLKVIRATSDMNIVGADVVEVAPAYDWAQMTGIAASHVVYELLSAMTPKV